MAVSLLLKQQLARWYPLEPIDIQLKLINDPARFKVVPAGRRSGKTERAKRHIIKECMANPGGLYFIAAPTYAQVKKIYWQDIKKMALTALGGYKISESDLMITFPNGTELHLIGLDKPTRIEGIPWDRVIIDEAAYVKEEAWVTSIAPALDTRDPTKPGKKAWCWIIGKPAGLNWYYRLYNYAKTANDLEWAAYTWFSSEVLDSETIAAAKRRMSAKDFRQEYEASFETVSGRIYEDYGPENYCSDIIMPHEQICYFCDFNFTPMSHGIGVCRDQHCDISTKKVIQAFYVLDEIVLESAVAEQNALEFVEKYKNHMNKNLRLYGDQNGRNGEKHNIDSAYITMERVFEAHGWKVDRRVQTKNPSILGSQNAVRAMICNADGARRLFVNPVTAPWMHEGLATVVLKEGSAFLEDDKNKYQHITTGLRYLVDYEWPVEDGIIDLDVTMWGELPYVIGGY